MRFTAVGRFAPGVVGPDPYTNPGDVPLSSILMLPNPTATLSEVRSSVIVLDAPPAETLTVDVFVIDEDSLPDPNADEVTAADLAKRRFYLAEMGVVLTGGTLFQLNASVSYAGPVYLRRSADTLTTTREVRGSSVSG